MTTVRIAALLVSAYTLSACASQGTSPPPPPEPTADDAPTHGATSGNRSRAPSPGKPSAPVEVSADIHVAERRAVITLVVAREARDLEVRVRGIDGVTIVTPSAPVRAPTAPAGEKITLDVSFSSTNPDGTLVVEVEGTFAGRPLGAVRTFSLGKPPAAGPKDPPRTDASGRPIVVLPGN
jgi:hypothetical protein